MAVRNAFNNSVQPKTAKIVGHRSDGIVDWIKTQQLCQQHAHFVMVEPSQWETEYDQYGKERLYALIAEAEGGSSLSFHLGGANISFADGHIIFLNQGISIKALAALVTANGEELVNAGDY